MFKIPGFNTQPAKYKSHNQVPQKVQQEDMDSADELDDPGNEDVAAFQKIPESHTRQNHAMFLTRVASDSDQLFRHRSGSPFKEKHLNNQSHNRTLSRDHTTEALKKLLYNKSPKEAAQEYLNNSLKLQQQKQQNPKQPKSNRASDSPPKLKNSPYPFHNNSSIYSNQENLSRAGDHTSSRVGFEPEPASAYTELAQKIYVERFLKKDNSRKTNVGLSPDSSRSQLLLSTNAALNVEEKRYLASSKIQDEITQRLLKEGEIRDQHHKALASAYLSKEQEECTFSPSILTVAPRRNVNQFLEDQKQYQTQVEMKKKALQEQAQHTKLKDQGTFKPEICYTSAKMVARKRQDSAPVYERLYNIGKNAHTKMMQNIAENGEDLYYEGRGSTDSGNFVGPISPKDAHLIASGKYVQEKPVQNFIPTIDKKSKMIKRNDRIDHLLYSDALRRQHKMSEHTKSKSKSISISTPGVSFATKKATATRFIKEFDIAILEFLEEDKDPKLNYIQLNEFLRKLRFLKESEQFESPRFTPERLLLFDMWYILYGDKYKGIHRRNLLVFLLGVLNLHFPITKIQPQENHPLSEENSMTDMKKGDISPSELGPEHFINPGMPKGERKVIGIFDDGVNYSLSEDEVRKVHKIYDLWYLNRLSAADNIGQLINARNFEEHSHHPVTNESSKAMAQNYRERILENTVDLIQQNKIAAPRGGKLTHADLLNVTKKIAEEKVHKFGELMQSEEVKDCTFRPQTTQYGSMMTSPSMRSMRASTSDLRSPDSKRTNMMPTGPLGGKERGFELYSLAKPRVLKRDKPSEELEYEKNYDECTFHPQINHGRPKDSHDTHAKGADRVVDRLRNANAEKSLQKFKKGRGNSTGSEGHFVFSLKTSKFKKDSFGGGVGKGSTTSSRGLTEQSSRKQLHSSVSASDKKHHTSLNTYHLKSDENLPHHHHSQQHHHHSVEEDYGDYGGDYDGNYEVDQQYGEPSHHHHDHHEEVHNQIHHEDEGRHQKLHHHDEEERTPLLFVDVNLGQGRAERIIVREGDQSLQLAQQFCIEHNLDSGMISRLKELLDAQIAGLLTRIEEEGHSTPSETDRRGYQFSGGKIQEEDDYIEDDSYHHHHHHRR